MALGPIAWPLRGSIAPNGRHPRRKTLWFKNRTTEPPLACGMTQPIIDDTGQDQFAVSVDRDTAKLEYLVDGHRLLLLHTEVPGAFRGQGVGGRLVESAVAKARMNHLTIVPWCPYARRWIEEHPEQIGDVSVDLKTPPPE